MSKIGSELFYVAEEEMHAVDVLIVVPAAAVQTQADQPILDGVRSAFSHYDHVRAGGS